ncbi:carboxymuconolactone decarboxylase family protein [Paraburkholderia unamae]|uniref:Peroxidase-related enzyme n=1 Tax=Paraburkholderia unamae TaxID=219649 RepID=A0ABX5K925_9BURK|nr:carboxymuconolactone decarboxylase family protein [Paraburkholderia unamae]PVX71094.1 putative peroxidase-related enzyme [Paraburkholderia unamae]CAG9246902.1 Putative peroxidase-related enzyme [Paraburkholderia unamae]
MSRLSAIKPEAATGAAADIFAKIRKAVGKVPNAYATIGTHSPEALGALLAVEGVIAAGTLSKPDIETIKLAVSEVAGCDYCLAAHTLAGKFAGLAPETMKAVRAGEPSGDAERDALVHFVRVLVTTHGTLPEADVSAIREAGYTERQIVEIALAVTSITFTNLVNRINDTTLDFPRAP